MKKRKIIQYLSLVVALLLLCACGKNLPSGSENSGEKVVHAENAPKYVQILGENEKEVITDVGEGENQGSGSNTADNGTVRQYTDKVYGAKANCSVLFKDDQVNMVYITYDPKNMDFNTLLSNVSKDYGSPDTKYESAEGGSSDDSSTAQWKLDNDGSIFIYETTDGCGIQIAS